jgi:hypothetical protein
MFIVFSQKLISFRNLIPGKWMRMNITATWKIKT